MKKPLYPVICLFMLVLTNSCASIVSRSEWPVKITSTPEGANVSITELRAGKKIYEGKTPATVRLSMRGGYFRGC